MCIRDSRRRDRGGGIRLDRENRLTLGEDQGFWKIFGKVLKEGVVDTQDYKEDLSFLFRFSSTHEDTEEQKVSLKDYVDRMQEGQNSIYYVIADSYMMAKSSPHLEIFKKKGIEVLILSDPIDEWVTSHLTDCLLYTSPSPRDRG